MFNYLATEIQFIKTNDYFMCRRIEKNRNAMQIKSRRLKNIFAPLIL